ncbi:hypothetical protein R5R35_012904 [Gryllus longicercus]|uniref:Uncharacterized protein n=1 Tax=Gryllus longicercus TaxID=2509291 RepID=A0AAN9VWE0_9ORTH
MDFWFSKCFAQLCSRLQRRRHQRGAGRSRHRQWRGGGVGVGGCVGGGGGGGGGGSVVGGGSGMEARAMSRSLVHYGRMGPPAPLGSPEPLMAHDFYDCCLEDPLPPGK